MSQVLTIPAPSPASNPAATIQPVQVLQTPISNSKSPGVFLQRKLTVGAPDDPHEREADAMADRVTRMPDRNFLQQKCVACNEEDKEQNADVRQVTPFIQRLPIGASPVSQSATAVTAPRVRFRPTGSITRSEFDTYVQTHYGVADVHTGTQTEQEQRITRRGVPAPTIPAWQTWDPGPASQDYTSIIDGMEEVISSIGAMPQVVRIIFFQVAYEPDPTTGVGVPQTDTGASFGAGELVIYEAFTGTTRPAAGPSTAQGTPTRPRSRSADISYNIVHELGHGVGEAGSNNSRQMFDEYNAAVGWIGTPAVLYDMGQPEVTQAITNSTTLPASHIITPNRWSNPAVIEQPMSRYAVEGGPSEDFAEAVAAYVTNPSALLLRSPLRFNFIHSRIASWTPRMRRMLPGVVRPPVGDFPEPNRDTMYA